MLITVMHLNLNKLILSTIFSPFVDDFKRDSNLTTLKRYGLGICPSCCNPCEDIEFKPPRMVKWHSGNISRRLQYASEAGVVEVDIWANLGIGETCADTEGEACWWKPIADWLQAP